MTRKETLDYINNMDITELLKYDLRKYTNRLFDEYFETYVLIREGHYYNDHVDLVRECYIEYSIYLYALCRANVISNIEFYELENTAYDVYEILQSEEE
jgi:hypothetical protein